MMWTVRCEGSTARVCKATFGEIVPIVRRLALAGRKVYVAYVRRDS